MRLEIIIERDPDGGTYTEYFADGQPVDPKEIEIIEYHIDPGSGGADDEWVEGQTEEAEEASPAARESLLRKIQTWKGWGV